MADFNKLLVAVAFSPYTEGIFRYAARLANRLNAEMVVASIINERDVAAVRSIADMGYDVDGEHYVGDIKKERRETIEGLVKDCGFATERITTVIKVGNPVNELLKIIAHEEIDLVVMGVKGRTNLEHALVGSVAEKLFRRSPATIVSYRDDQLAERLRRRVPK
ncbi:MAG: universal stress protein [Desulfobacteraceae bacterium]|jgi:nucleotide-binding universal stress UspA family protein